MRPNAPNRSHSQGSGNARALWRCCPAEPRASGRLHINEINTIPGFTSISMYPKMWEHCGIPYPKLIDRLIELAIERQKGKRALRYSR